MKQEFKMPDGEIVNLDFPQWKTPYNHDTNFESDRTAHFSNELSKTKQEFVQEADINTIMNRVLKLGEVPPIVMPEHFLDLTTRKTHFEMQEAIAETNAMFYTLPANIREKHLNDPARWADAVVNATNARDGAALDELGIDTTAERKAALAAAQAEADKAAEAAHKAAKGGETPKPPTDNAKT